MTWPSCMPAVSSSSAPCGASSTPPRIPTRGPSSSPFRAWGTPRRGSRPSTASRPIPPPCRPAAPFTRVVRSSWTGVASRPLRRSGWPSRITRGAGWPPNALFKGELLVPMTALLEARGLTKLFPVGRGLFGRGGGAVRAVDGISFAIEPGRTLGIVGESGCGKTTTAKLLLKLEEPTAGEILFDGTDVTSLNGDGLNRYRRSVQAVFQDPFASLSPRMRVSAIIAEPLVTNELLTASEVRKRVLQLLDLVGLPERSADLFPHEFSGGQRQRIAIARALALSPKLVVLDEPVSALDVSIRAQILNLLRDLQSRLGLSYLFIAHDLAAVAHMSHTIAVMYLGKIVEIGNAETVAATPRHPYTQALFSAALPSHPDEKRDEVVVTGEVPSPLAPPAGCRFHPRCPHAMARCSAEEPALLPEAGRLVACHLYTGVRVSVGAAAR